MNLTPKLLTLHDVRRCAVLAFLCTGIVMSIPTPLFAQQITDIRVRVVSATGNDAVAPRNIPLASMNCTRPVAQQPPHATSNPGGFTFVNPNDISGATYCDYDDPPNGVFSLVPIGPAATQYTLRGSFINAAGGGPEAATPGFSHPGVSPTAAPAQLRTTSGS